LILAYSGLSWVECGKGDAFQIQRSITGPVLAGCRVKTKEKYYPSYSKVERINYRNWIITLEAICGK